MATVKTTCHTRGSLGPDALAGAKRLSETVGIEWGTCGPASSQEP
jgi:hypothetical protein